MKIDTGFAPGKWILTKMDLFWNQIAPSNHVFHIYEHEEKFLDILAGFVGTGINADECTIVIATASHLEKLRRKLESHGLHVSSLIEDDRYIPVAAEKTLAKFMVNGLPDEHLFLNSVSEIIQKAKKRNRRVRTFREMVTILKSHGNQIASSKLESLWNKFHQKNAISLFCAYPKSMLAKGDCESISENGFRHSKVIANTNSVSELLYKECFEGS